MTRAVDATPELVLERQRAAQRLVSDETIRGAFERVKQDYITGWTRTQPIDREKRESAYMLYKAICDVWGLLERDALAAHARDLKAQGEKNG